MALLKLPLTAEQLNSAMQARGMMPLSAAAKPMAFSIHPGVDSFERLKDWVARKAQEYRQMAKSDREREPELEIWVRQHAAAFGAVHAALESGMEAGRLQAWVGKFARAATFTRIRLQMEDFHMGSERGERVFALCGAWGTIRNQIDYALSKEPEKNSTSEFSP